MARYTEPVCRQCRRENQKLFLKGDRCYTQKCAITRRATPPGQHGLSRKKPSDYGIQLREKQKARRAYGVFESQFRKYFIMAEKMKGVTGENMLQLLERRLDNVIFRLAIASSRAQARQMVTHGHILINGKKVDIPSYLVDVNDVISIKESSQDSEIFKSLREGTSRLVPAWLELDAPNLKGVVKALPARGDIDLSLEEHLIVELYSK